MTIDSDDMISLPSPPPPRPAARRAAIDAAMRRFDGIEEAPVEQAPRQRPSRIARATMNRRPAGALVSAVLIAIVFIPAMPFILRDSTPRVAPQAQVTDQVQPSRDASICTGADCAGPASSAPNPAQSQEMVVAAPSPSPAQPVASPPATAEAPRDSGSAASDRTAALEAPTPLVAAAPPPLPPAPPPPPPQPASEGERNIVVTGSILRRSNSVSQNQPTEVRDAAKPASPSATIGSYGEFLSQLQAGLEANDRRAIVGLIGFPLRVKLQGRTQTYSSAQQITRDFDRIFTPQVRSAVLNLRLEDLMSRDGGRLKGNGRLWFGCGNAPCLADAPIRIREVNP